MCALDYHSMIWNNKNALYARTNYIKNMKQNYILHSSKYVKRVSAYWRENKDWEQGINGTK